MDRDSDMDGFYRIEDRIAEMKDRKLASVALNAAKDRVTFTFLDGHEVSFGVEGDCCSKSWIEHLETFPDMRGSVLVGITVDVMDQTANDAMNPMRKEKEDWQEEYQREHDCLQVYHTRFKFDRGEVILEYRNSSNGYYGGYLV